MPETDAKQSRESNKGHHNTGLLSQQARVKKLETVRGTKGLEFQYERTRTARSKYN